MGGGGGCLKGGKGPYCTPAPPGFINLQPQAHTSMSIYCNSFDASQLPVCTYKRVHCKTDPPLFVALKFTLSGRVILLKQVAVPIREKQMCIQMQNWNFKRHEFGCNEIGHKNEGARRIPKH
jgi:hypothetical protein